MTSLLASLFAVMLLLDPSETVDVTAAAVSEEDDGGSVERQGRGTVVNSANIRSRASDFDRQEGVIMFEGDVVVTYSADCVMCADRLFMFLSTSNELSRVVALGHVSITNETRIGTCAMATYRRRKSEIEMFGDGKGVLAHLVEHGDDSEVEGTRIRFWLDAEQVEVENSRLTTATKGEAKVL